MHKNGLGYLGGSIRVIALSAQRGCYVFINLASVPQVHIESVERGTYTSQLKDGDTLVNFC